MDTARQSSFASNQRVTLTHLMERDESLLTFVPKHQPHTSETLDQRKPAKHAEFRVIAQDEWQSVVRYPAAQMMDVMNTNIGGEPAHNARQIIVRATVKRSLVQAPDVITAQSLCLVIADRG
jgi:hypothetical protein